MSGRRWTLIASAAMTTAAVAVVVVAATDRAETATSAPHAVVPTAKPTSSGATGTTGSAVVEDCSTRSEAHFPAGFTNRRKNVVVGPVALVGAGSTPVFRRGNKFPVLVRNGHRVTVELSRHTRRSAGLAYGPLPEGQVRLRYTHRVVMFIACRRGERSGSSADEHDVTFWSGGVLALSPRCVPLLVWVDDEPHPRRAVIRLGVRDCP